MRMISAAAEEVIVMYSEEMTREELESFIIKKLKDICDSTKFNDLDNNYDDVKILSQKLIELHQHCNFTEFHQSCSHTWEILNKKRQHLPVEAVINFSNIKEKIQYFLIQCQEVAFMQDEQIDASIRLVTTEIEPDHSWPIGVTEQLDNAIEILRHRKYSLQFFDKIDNRAEKRLGHRKYSLLVGDEIFDKSTIDSSDDIRKYIKSNLALLENYPVEGKRLGDAAIAYAICEFYQDYLDMDIELDSNLIYFLKAELKNQVIMEAYFRGIPVQYWHELSRHIIIWAIEQKNYPIVYDLFNQTPVENSKKEFKHAIEWGEVNVKEVREYLNNLLAFVIAIMENYYPENLNFTSKTIDFCTLIWDIDEYLRASQARIKINEPLDFSNIYAFLDEEDNDETGLDLQLASPPDESTKENIIEENKRESVSDEIIPATLSEEHCLYSDEPLLDYQPLSQIILDIIGQEQFDLLKNISPYFLKILVKDFPIPAIKKLVENGLPEWKSLFLLLLNPAINDPEIEMALNTALANEDDIAIGEILHYIARNTDEEDKGRPAIYYINYEKEVGHNRSMYEIEVWMRQKLEEEGINYQSSRVKSERYKIPRSIFDNHPKLLSNILALAERKRNYALIAYIQSNYYFFLSSTESVFSALFSWLAYLLALEKKEILASFPDKVRNLLNDYINLGIQNNTVEHMKILANISPLLLNYLDINLAKLFLHTAVQYGNARVVKSLLKHEAAEIVALENSAKQDEKLPIYQSKVHKLDLNKKTCFHIALEKGDATIMLWLLLHADVIMTFNINYTFKEHNCIANLSQHFLTIKQKFPLWLNGTGSELHCNPLLAEKIIIRAGLNRFGRNWSVGDEITNSDVLKCMLEAKTYIYVAPLFIKEYFAYEVISKLESIALALNDDESLIQPYLEGLYHYLENILCLYHQAKQDRDIFRVEQLESFQDKISQKTLAIVSSILPTIRNSELFLAYMGLLYRAISLGFRGMLSILTDMELQDVFADYLNKILESAFPSFGMPMQNIISHVKKSYMQCKNEILVATRLFSNSRAYTYLEQILHESSVILDTFTGSSYVTPLMHIIPLIAYSEWDWTNKNDISYPGKLINSLRYRYFRMHLLNESLWHQFKDDEEKIILFNLLHISSDEKEKLLSIEEINRFIHQVNMLIFLIQQEWDTEIIDRQTGDSIMHKALAMADLAYRQQSLVNANSNDVEPSIELIEKVKKFITLTNILINDLLDTGHTLTQTNKLKKYPLEQIENSDLINLVIKHSKYDAIMWEHTRLLILRNYKDINLVTQLLNCFRFGKLNLFDTDNQKNGILHLMLMNYQDAYWPYIVKRLLKLYVFLGENNNKQKPSDLARRNKLPAHVVKAVKKAENKYRLPAAQQYLLNTIFKGETKYVEGLIESGVPFLSARHEDNNNALHCAIIAGVPGIITILRKAGADALIYEPNDENIRPLRLAAAPGPHQNWACVKAMLSGRELNQHEKNIYSEILHWAVEALEDEMIKFLIEELGVNVNYLKDETILHYVIKHEVKIDIQGKNYKERDAAKSEVEVKRLKIIEIFLSHSNKIDPQEEDADGFTAFELAIMKGRDDIRQKFLERGLGQRRKNPNRKRIIDELKGRETLSYTPPCWGPNFDFDTFEEYDWHDEYADEREFNREIRLAAAAESRIQDVTDNREVNAELEVDEISSHPPKIDKGKRKYQSKSEPELYEGERWAIVILEQAEAQSSFSEGSTSTSIPAGLYQPDITHLTTHSIFALSEGNAVGGEYMSEQAQQNIQTIQEEGNPDTISKKYFQL